MSDMPWVRFFASDWLAGTRGMSASETGIYITLVASMYERGASAVAFKAALENLVGDGKIRRIDGGLWNGRVDRECAIRAEKSLAGKQAAEARWRKGRQIQRAADADAVPPHGPGTASQTPETRQQEPDGSCRKRGSRHAADFSPNFDDAAKAGLSPQEAAREAEKFRDYWISQPGQKGVKLDWPATWRNWCRNAAERRPRSPPPRKRTFVDVAMD